MMSSIVDSMLSPMTIASSEQIENVQCLEQLSSKDLKTLIVALVSSEKISWKDVNEKMPQSSLAYRQSNECDSSSGAQKTNLNSKWEPTCINLEGNMKNHSRDGNCMLYALYETCGNENLTENAAQSSEDSTVNGDINVRNLRRRIVEELYTELAAKCAGISKAIADDINGRKNDIKEIINVIKDREIELYAGKGGKLVNKSLFSKMKVDEDGIDKAIKYITENKLAAIGDITGNTERLTEIFSCFLKKTKKLPSLQLYNPETEVNVTHNLCANLILLSVASGFKDSPAINHDRLLNAIEVEVSDDCIDLQTPNSNTIGYICDKYNLGLENDRIILDHGRNPSIEVANIVKLAMLTMLTNVNNSWIHNDCLRHVAALLKRPILLIYEGVDGSASKEVSGATLYAVNGDYTRYEINNLGKLYISERIQENKGSFVDSYNLLSKLPDRTIAIAMRPGHYYGVPSFKSEGVYIGKNLVTGVNEQGLVLREPLNQKRVLRPQRKSLPKKSLSNLEKADNTNTEAEPDVLKDITVIRNIFGIGVGYKVSKTDAKGAHSDLDQKLEIFEKIFIPHLKKVSKNWQTKVECDNLANIAASCEYMLNTMHFKREFVAEFVNMRLSLAMFGAGNSGGVDLGSIDINVVPNSGKSKAYTPDWMFDFGRDRANIDIGNTSYSWDGMLASQGTSGKVDDNQQSYSGNLFSALRGRKDGEYYVMPDGQLTACLPSRFRNFLGFLACARNSYGNVETMLDDVEKEITSAETLKLVTRKLNETTELLNLEVAYGFQSQNTGVVRRCADIFADIIKGIVQGKKTFLSWQLFDVGTPLTKLPYSLMFIVGIQFGQNQVGSGNPFTLAAKKYIARQFEGGTSSFFWANENKKKKNAEEKSDEEYAFGDLMGKIWPEQGFSKDIARQFKNAVLAYYAITQEILSRVDFPGNDRQNRQVDPIFRLEDFDALEKMRIIEKKESEKGSIKKNNVNVYEVAAKLIGKDAQRPSIVSASLMAHVASLDRASDFPPPIKIITKYKNVPHPHIFGTYFFNVDSIAAKRIIDGNVFEGETDKEIALGFYTEGCPFFKDMQREVLLIPRGIEASITGILCFAGDSTNSFVHYATEADGRNMTAKEATGHDVTEYTLARLRKGKSASSAPQKRRLNQIEFCNCVDKSVAATVARDHGRSSDALMLEELQQKIAAVRKGFESSSLVKLKIVKSDLKK
jgi:hypothetical protein